MVKPEDFDDFATDLADRFVRPVGERRPLDFEWMRFQVNETPVFLADIQVATEALQRQCETLRRIKMSFPCILPRPTRGEVDGTPIPISLGFEGGWQMPMPFLAIAELLGSHVDRFLEDRILAHEAWEGSGGIVRVEIGEAISYFKKRLANFLSARLRGTPPSAARQAGVLFQVDTKSSGLRVYYAPIYWHNNQQVLDYPTTPVTGFVHPGRYHFGAGRPGKQPQFDFSASYKLPPDSKAYLGI